MGGSLCGRLLGVTPSRPSLWRAVEVPGPLSSLGAGASPLRLRLSLCPVTLSLALGRGYVPPSRAGADICAGSLGQERKRASPC